MVGTGAQFYQLCTDSTKGHITANAGAGLQLRPPQIKAILRPHLCVKY